MARSFDLVDNKVGEAEFFLKKIRASLSNPFEVRCYVSAFVSSARSVTFALQAVLGKQEGFDSWYQKHQNSLKDDSIARFFHKFRTVNQHIGDNLVGLGLSSRDSGYVMWFQSTEDIDQVPSEDVLSACNQYFMMLLEIVIDCYRVFGPEIDPQQRYTPQYFQSIGKSIEDAEEELGFPRGWTDIGDPNALPWRFAALRRDIPGCRINDIFDEYLGKTTPSPPELQPYTPPEI